MKGIKKAGILIVCISAALAVAQVFADTEDNSKKIKQGVFIDAVDVGNMTYEEAMELVEDHIAKKSEVKVSILVNKTTVETTLKELGYEWTNRSIVEEAVNLGKFGNIIKRYKDEIDLKNEALSMKWK